MAKRKPADTHDTKIDPPAIEGEQIVRANVNRHTDRDAKFMSYYVNDAQFQTTPWDIRITMGQIAGVSAQEDAPTMMVMELFELRMSPSFAKQVAKVLIGQLQHYEQTIGPIPLPLA